MLLLWGGRFYSVGSLHHCGVVPVHSLQVVVDSDVIPRLVPLLDSKDNRVLVSLWNSLYCCCCFSLGDIIRLSTFMARLGFSLFLCSFQLFGHWATL